MIISPTAFQCWKRSSMDAGQAVDATPQQAEDRSAAVPSTSGQATQPEQRFVPVQTLGAGAFGERCLVFSVRSRCLGLHSTRQCGSGTPACSSTRLCLRLCASNCWPPSCSRLAALAGYVQLVQCLKTKKLLAMKARPRPSALGGPCTLSSLAFFFTGSGCNCHPTQATHQLS